MIKTSVELNGHVKILLGCRGRKENIGRTIGFFGFCVKEGLKLLIEFLGVREPWDRFSEGIGSVG